MQFETFTDLILAELDTQTARIDKCVGRLSEEIVWRRPRAGVNSVGNLCLHLAGNESHYIGHGMGDSGYVRDRSSEFNADGGFSREELLAKLREARQTTKAVFAKLGPDDMTRHLKLDHPENATGLSVIIHVFDHYAYHTGQIVLLTRQWQESEERVLPWGH